MTHTVKDLTTDFTWKRGRLFDKEACEVFLDICNENPTATVELVENKPKNKWRPVPLDTIVLCIFIVILQLLFKTNFRRWKRMFQKN